MCECVRERESVCVCVCVCVCVRETERERESLCLYLPFSVRANSTFKTSLSCHPRCMRTCDLRACSQGRVSDDVDRQNDRGSHRRTEEGGGGWGKSDNQHPNFPDIPSQTENQLFPAYHPSNLQRNCINTLASISFSTAAHTTGQ